MKNFKSLLTALTLALFISSAAFAGEIQGVGTPNPSPQPIAGCPIPGEIQGVGCSAPSSAEEQNPGALNSSFEEALDGASIGAIIVAQFLSAIF